MKMQRVFYSLTTVLLQAGLVFLLLFSGWLIYSRLPNDESMRSSRSHEETLLQIVLRPASDLNANALDIAVELSPIDIVSVQHEYFTERRPGKRYDDFLNERMKGRRPVTTRLDRQGHGSVVITPGNWWLHAVLSGEEDLEWRLPIAIAGRSQTIELTSQNIYTRTRSF